MFRLRTKEPPEAPGSSEVYETVEARCQACVVKGGREQKCVSAEWQATIGEPLGLVCPRVELWPDLYPDAEILEFAMNERLRPMAGLRAELVGQAHGMTAEELNDSLARVAYVLADPAVSGLINPAGV